MKRRRVKTGVLHLSMTSNNKFDFTTVCKQFRTGRHFETKRQIYVFQ